MKGKQKYAIIVAGGAGKRMGGDLPKQFMLLSGKPILMHTLEKFHAFDANMPLILVLPSEQHNYWLQLVDQFKFQVPHELAEGGLERFHSVSNGLAKINQDGLAAIHDGVRPLVSKETIKRCFNAAAAYSAAIPVIPVTESIRWKSQDISKAMNRNEYFLVQTPQIFDVKLLQDAYKQSFNDQFTDDASVVESFGHNVHLVEGNPENIKITRPIDLIIADSLLKNDLTQSLFTGE